MTTQSMAVIEIRGHKYFSLMCRASDGNIWEHYYRIDGRRWRGWDWRNMSN